MTLPPLQRRDPQDAGSKLGISRAWESKLINIDQTTASGGGVGKEVEEWTHSGVPQLVVMSSSAYSPTTSRSPSPPSQPSSSEDSEGHQDCRRIEAMYCSHEGGLSHIPQSTDRSFAELSVAMAGPSGPSSGVDVMQPLAGVAPSTHSKSGICLGVVQLVPEGSRVVQAEVMLEQFAEAVGRVRGPPTFKWCQAAAPCASCTQRGEQCEFEAPASGVQQDMSVCLLCRSRHKKCSVTLSWHAACIAAEQGWDQDWVAAQLEEGRKGRVSGRGSGGGEGERVSMPAMKVGPPQGGWREGAPSMQEKGKRRASPSPEAGPSKRAWGEQVMGGPPGSAVYSPTSGAPIEQSADRSWSVAEAFLQCWVESLERLLVAHEEEVQGGTGLGAEGQGHCHGDCHGVIVSSAGVGGVDSAFAGAGRGGRGGDAAGGRLGGVGGSAGFQHWGSPGGSGEGAAVGGMACQRGGLGPARNWAREHRILLNRASAALGSIHDGLARMPGDLPLELGQGVTQMGHLLAGHWWRATADPRAWWEMATDMGELLPGQPKVLATVVAQLEVFMVGRVAGLGLEEE
ncbi:hypothetical protein E4T56_gene10871 [Termitomyces sp. T112]|nr:hypothetical protein E4T56_gene10871 [Termitomyces sp. T112]